MEYEKQLNIQFHPSTIYHLHNHNHTVASSNANKRSTSGGTRGWSTATRCGRYGLSVCAVGGEAEQAGLRDELLLQPATCRRRHRRRARCVPSCSTTTRAEREGQHGATCACMRVVLCRLWVLNVWLLCTHTHTHTRVRAH